MHKPEKDTQFFDFVCLLECFCFWKLNFVTTSSA